MRYVILFAAILTLPMLACAGGGYGIPGPPSYRVHVLEDEFRGSTIYRMERNRLPAPPSRGLFDMSVPYAVELNAQRTDIEGVPVYSLMVWLRGNGWLFINRGESLHIMAGGEPLSLYTADGSARHRNVGYGGEITERAWYPVTAEILRSIAQADTAWLRLEGSQRYIERELHRANLENIAQFVAEYVDERPAEPDA